MDLKHAGSSLDALISAFNSRIVDLQELVIARNMYPKTSITDLSAVDTTLKAMESQIQAIKQRLQEERSAIPKAKKLIEMSQRQQRKLQHMLAHVPAAMRESFSLPNRTPSRTMLDMPDYESSFRATKFEEEPLQVTAPKETKGRSSAPRWFVTADELDSLSSYMRGRLTLEKVNIGINEMAVYADTNAQLVTAPRKKLAEDAWEKALELRDIAAAESVRGKHFFLETDIKGPGMKLDNTGKAILTAANLGHCMLYIQQRQLHRFFVILGVFKKLESAIIV